MWREVRADIAASNSEVAEDMGVWVFRPGRVRLCACLVRWSSANEPTSSPSSFSKNYELKMSDLISDSTSPRARALVRLSVKGISQHLLCPLPLGRNLIR